MIKDIINVLDYDHYQWLWMESKDNIRELLFDADIIVEACKKSLVNDGKHIGNDLSIFVKTVVTKANKQAFLQKMPDAGDIILIDPTLQDIFAVLFLMNEHEKILALKEKISQINEEDE